MKVRASALCDRLYLGMNVGKPFGKGGAALGSNVLARRPLLVPLGPRRHARARAGPRGRRRGRVAGRGPPGGEGQGQKIDLALIDLLLPDGIGTDVIRDLRRTKPGLPVLVLTVARGPDLYSWVRAMGADEMISKDASSRELLAAIRLLLRR
ncbi:MAG: hypothetical protein CYG60_14045 [Actinobacteria bacterium]|nr:MAG: hypothetical protein CYG60_14045 [Actinomycetota bacterium]